MTDYEKSQEDPAFPQPITYNQYGESENPWNGGYGGLTKREWYVGLAMQALIMAGATALTIDPDMKAYKEFYADIPKSSFALADKMIAKGKSDD